MATYSRHFGGEALGSTATPSGFTKFSDTSSYMNLLVVADAGAVGGRSLQYTIPTTTSFLTWDTPGQHADMELLAQVKATDITTAGYQGPHTFLRADQASTTYVAMRMNNAATGGIATFYGTGPGASFVSGSNSTAKSPAANEWWWFRQQIIGANLKVKYWLPADQSDPLADEPVGWDQERTLTGHPTAANYAAFGGREQAAAAAHIGYISVTDSPSTESAPGPTTFAVGPTVATGADDGYHSSTSVLDTSALFVILGATTIQYSPFSRFLLNVPQGATINSAILRVWARNSHLGGSPNMRIYADDVDNSTAPTTSADFLGRARTTEFAVWDSEPTWPTTDLPHDTPDFANVVQEVVDRTSWASGNGLTLLIDDQTSAASTERRWHSQESATGGTDPLLIVEYTTAGAPTPLTLTPDGQVSVSNIVDQAAGSTNLHLAVDETFSTPDDDTTYLVNTSDATGQVVLTLSDSPGDLGTLSTLTISLRVRHE